MTLTLNAQTSLDNSIHQFKVADIYGNIFDFSQLKGKKVMINLKFMEEIDAAARRKRRASKEEVCR